ncbi:MAG: hypothetical protein RL621_1821 [Bacteroidota bacterium]|jgi:hypothetical protein
MRVYNIWDYMTAAVDIFHFTMLIGLFGGMIYLFVKELKKFS